MKIDTYNKKEILKNKKLIKRLQQIDKECFPIFYKNVETWSFENYLKKIKRLKVYVAKERNKVIGSLLLEGDDKNERIKNIAVDTNFQRKGIGSALLKETLFHKKDIYLHVRTTNIKAIELYKKYNFKIEKIEKEACYEGDCFLMKRKHTKELQ